MLRRNSCGAISRKNSYTSFRGQFSQFLTCFIIKLKDFSLNFRHSQSKPVSITAGSKLPLPKTSNLPLRTASNVNRSIGGRPVGDTLKTYCTEDTPAVLSHAGSNSDISILSISNDSKSKRDYLSDASSNLSADDENLLAECIQSGMPKSKDVPSGSSTNKCMLPRSNLHTSTPMKYNNATGRRSNRSENVKRDTFNAATNACDYLSDASSNLSADDDNILAECIKSGMPKSKMNYNNDKSCQLASKVKYTEGGGGSEVGKVQNVDINRKRDHLPLVYNAAKDEYKNYAVEISPAQFSLRSSLSDLTVDGSVARLKR